MEVDNLATITTNLRYALWKQFPGYYRWPNMLEKAIGVRGSRAAELIGGRAPSARESELICDRFGLERDSFVAASLIQLAPVEVLKQNVMHLMRGLRQGGQKNLANTLKVRIETVSRWANGKVPPTKERRRKILRYFGLPETIDMERSLLFLSTEPIGTHKQRSWLRERIELIGHEELTRLFPALVRLLEKS